MKLDCEDWSEQVAVVKKLNRHVARTRDSKGLEEREDRNNSKMKLDYGDWSGSRRKEARSWLRLIKIKTSARSPYGLRNCLATVVKTSLKKAKAS